jgi:hypothetical protein
MAGFTNKFKFRIFDWLFRATAAPTNFYIALVTSAAAPVADTNTKSQLTELTQQFGYTTGGISLTKNATDFDVLTEDDANDRALVQIKDMVWTASGGSIGAARYAIMTDDNGTQGSREVLGFWDLTSDRTVSDGQTLTLQNLELRLTE